LIMDIEKHIESVLISQDFDSLSPAQVEMVLSCMTELEYSNQRKLLVDSKLMFEDEGALLCPDPDLLFSLKEAHVVKRKRIGLAALLFFIATFRLPVYQVGIAAVLLFMFFWLRQETITNDGLRTPQIVYETVLDTVEVIKEVPIEIVVPTERIVREIVYMDRPAMDVDLALNLESNNGITPPAVAPDLASMQQSFGNSSFASEDLDQFRVGI